MNDNITLDPELAKIAREIRTAPTTTAAWGEGTGGGPEVVTVKVKWQPHPLDDAARPEVWEFKMKRVHFGFTLLLVDVLLILFSLALAWIAQ